MAPDLTQMKRFANLYVSKEGHVYLPSGTLYPYEKRYNRDGEPDGYLYVRIRGHRRSVHSLMGQLWVPNPLPKIFDRVDHVTRVKTNNHKDCLRWVNSQLNAINRVCMRNVKFNETTRMWEGSFWTKQTKHEVGSFKVYHEAFNAVMEAKMNMYHEIYNGLIDKHAGSQV